MLAKIRGERNHTKHWQECKLVLSLWRSLWSFFRKPKLELPYNPAVPLLVYTQNKQSHNTTEIPAFLSMFISALLKIVKLKNQPMCPSTDEWIKKMWYTYTMEYNSVIKNKIMQFAGKWMEQEIFTLSKISQTQKGKTLMFSFICETDLTVEERLFGKRKGTCRTGKRGREGKR
jgi:hypothetical protein